MAALRKTYLQLLNDGPSSLRGYLAFLGLWPLSCFYAAAVRVRLFLYSAGFKQIYRASVPVISVGNLAVGGTGKTPMTDFLVKYLSGRAVKCAIVSRGYGGSYRQAVGRVADAQGHLLMTPQECGDEPCLLALRNPGVPVYVARQRMLGVQAAEQEGARLILLDDGFQHLAVQRELDIVLLDAQDPVGNGRVLPAGLLREPVSALQRADLIVMTRSDVATNKTLPVKVPVILSRHQLSDKLTTLDGKAVAEKDYAGKRCLAFAGIARPAEFFRSLRVFDFFCAEEVALADHQEYTPESLNRLLGSCHNYDFLVTTEKDAVKLAAVNFPIPCYQVGVDLTFDDVSPLAGMLERIIKQCA